MPIEGSHASGDVPVAAAELDRIARYRRGTGIRYQTEYRPLHLPVRSILGNPWLSD